MADLIDYVIQVVREVAPELSPEKLHQLEMRVREERGGMDGGYLAKRRARMNAAKLGEALRARTPLQQGFADIDVSRATGYRLLRRK